MRTKFIGTQHWTLAMVLLVSAWTVHASTTNFFTGFETNEGYTVGSPLVGSQGWVGVLAKPGQVTNASAAGNGITNRPLATQQAYVGCTPIPGTYSNLSVWQPLTPIAANATNVTFSVQMEILDGNGGVGGNSYDAFLWKVYNAQSNLLFAVKFDENTGGCTYWLSASNAWYSPPGNERPFYSSLTVYSVLINMNPASNTWSATRNGTIWIDSQPMTPAGTNLSIAYVAAAWDITTPGSPGDNLMAFDNYGITSDVPTTQTPPSRPQLTLRSARAGGPATIRLTGQNGYKFAVDARSNFTTTNWTALVTNTVTTNSFDYTDPGAAGLGSRYYRARWAP